jgi:hypothetical protein
LIAFTDECDIYVTCALNRPGSELLNIDTSSLHTIEEFLREMSRHSVYYEQRSVPSFTIANIIEKTIADHLTYGANLHHLADALQIAIEDEDVDMLLKMTYRPPMFKAMQSFFVSYCPDKALESSETKTLDEWFESHSKNNIAPIYLLW